MFAIVRVDVFGGCLSTVVRLCLRPSCSIILVSIIMVVRVDVFGGCLSTVERLCLRPSCSIILVSIIMVVVRVELNLETP